MVGYVKFNLFTIAKCVWYATRCAVAVIGNEMVFSVASRDARVPLTHLYGYFTVSLISIHFSIDFRKVLKLVEYVYNNRGAAV